MPELAEVERGRRLLENAILHKSIASTSTQADPLVFVGESATQLEKHLPGRTVVGVHRKGKNVYLRLDGSGPTLAFHLGMTGSVAIKDGEFHYRRPRYIKRISKEWPPWRWKILLKMTDGTEVCTIDTSRFGRIRAIDASDAASIPPLSLLARDAWLDLPSAEELILELACRTAPIKTVLLDQNAAVCGLGNYNVDEVLFHARIHPRQPAYTLNETQVKNLHAAVKKVAAMVMDVDADTKKLPKTWLYKHRYGRKSGIGQKFVMEDGTETQVTHDRINGRITALTDVQVLVDYAHVPLPRKRKRTVVEEDIDDVGSGCEEVETPRPGQRQAKPPKRKRERLPAEAEKKVRSDQVEEEHDGQEISEPKKKSRKRTNNTKMNAPKVDQQGSSRRKGKEVQAIHDEREATSGPNLPGTRFSARLRQRQTIAMR